MSLTPTMENVMEPVIEQFKAELEATGLFTEINEGEYVYEGSGRVAMVFPGPDRPRSIGLQQLEHRMPIYTIILDSDEDTTPEALRKDMHPAYDALMEDVSHSGTCWLCLPTLWHPGLLQWGDRTFVGILGMWLARIMQTYVPP